MPWSAIDSHFVALVRVRHAGQGSLLAQFYFAHCSPFCLRDFVFADPDGNCIDVGERL